MTPLGQRGNGKHVQKLHRVRLQEKETENEGRGGKFGHRNVSEFDGHPFAGLRSRSELSPEPFSIARRPGEKKHTKQVGT